ncbi:hypothetical protein [Kribbella sp. NPDC000426]|uniref:hypothetical protein n=1 Tax=Kribbella sp. NPDC000426 TaxID=3154255 RepID=UPI00332CD32E
MAGWESLRVDLLRLHEESPGALVVWPSPETERRSERRFWIQLAAWATEIAGTLNATYGDVVDLQVGAMTFPGGELLESAYARQLPGVPADAAGLVVEAFSPLSVRSGRSAHGEVEVTNRADHTQLLYPSRNLHATLTDRRGNVVGRYVGPINAGRIGLPLEPQQSHRLTVLIGAASVVPELGYAVPPGEWNLVISLQTDERFLLSEPLKITVTP